MLKFNRIDTNFVRADYAKAHNGRTVYPIFATIQQNSYGRKLWQIEINNKRFVDEQGYDCFTLTNAKRIIKDAYKQHRQEDA